MANNESIEVPEKLEVEKLDTFFREMGGIRYYRPMQTIIKDGDDVDGLYLLVSGMIGFYKNGVNVGVQSSEESTFFGEIALIMGDSHRTADVVSLNDCEVRVVFGDIDGILKSRVDIAKTLMVNNARRILQLNKLLGEKENLIAELRSKKVLLTEEENQELAKMYQMAYKMTDPDNRWLTAQRMLQVIEGKKPPQAIKRFDPAHPVSSIVEIVAQRKKETLIDSQFMKPKKDKPEEKGPPEGKKDPPEEKKSSPEQDK